MKCGAGTFFFIIARRLNPDRSAVRFDDTTSDGQTQTGAAAFEFGLSAGMQIDPVRFGRTFQKSVFDFQLKCQCLYRRW